MKDLLLVGRIARAHGNRGQVIVNPETDFIEDRYRAGAVLWVGAETAATPHEILSVRMHQGRPVVALAGVETMNDAEALAGSELWMPRSSLGQLPDGTYYRHDLVGCVVVHGQGATAIGRVSRVEGTLDRSYLIVETPSHGEVMIPMVAEFCVEVDVDARRITVSMPEGLIDVNSAGRAGG